MMRAILLACLLALAPLAGAHAQAPSAPVTGFNPTASEVHEDQVLHGLAPVRGAISIPDEKAATLIQPAGRLWRDYRRSVEPWLGAACVLGVLALLAVFYLVRGRIRMEGGPSGRTIIRFSHFERFMHWLAAVSWCVLALSGLNMAFGRIVLLPVLGQDAFSAVSTATKFAHNFTGFPFTLGIVLMLLVWSRDNILAREDIDWLKTGGGLVGHGEPQARKFNFGQKVVFWIVILGGGLTAASGYSLAFPFVAFDVGGQQVAQVVHGGMALLMIAAMLGHIYIGSLGMEGAFAAMGSGEVDLKWARTHHSLWVEEQMEKARHAADAAE